MDENVLRSPRKKDEEEDTKEEMLLNQRKKKNSWSSFLAISKVFRGSSTNSSSSQHTKEHVFFPLKK